MTAPRWLAHANKFVTNRTIGLLGPWAPGFGVVVHTGRKSGKPYRTPINVFRRPGGYTVALTYGPQSEWVKNVLAAGGCSLITRGKTVRLDHPRLYKDDTREAVPPIVGAMLVLLNVPDFMDLSLAEPSR